MKKPTTITAMTIRVMAIALRTGFGVAWFGAEVMVTPPS